MSVHEARIERSRREMSATIAEIQERLSPPVLAGQAKHALKEATVGKAGRMVDTFSDRVSDSPGTLIGRIKANPVPAALVGTGLLWMMFGGKKTRNSGTRPAYGGSRLYTERNGGGAASQVSETLSGAAGQVSETVSGAADHVTGAVSQATGQVTSAVSQAAQSAGDTASEVGTQAQYQVQRIQSTLQQALEENPLPVALVAAGLGALMAAAVPRTAAEDKILAPARDQISGQARQLGDKVSHVADRAQSAARDEAHRQNLT